jgi:hypothetical protein
MVLACRVCERTIDVGRECMDFSTVMADISSLEGSCAKVEVDLHDSFNAFCFKCHRITMSVPRSVSVNEQVCYLRSQVHCFEELQSYGLVLRQAPSDEME